VVGDQHFMMATSTLNAGDPIGESSIDAAGYVPAETKTMSEEKAKTISEDRGKSSCPKNPMTDFFAYPSVADDDEIQFNKQCPLYGNYDDDADDIKSDSKIERFRRMFPTWQIKTNDVCFKITPAVGAVCYEYFSLSVMDPIGFSRSFGGSEDTVKNVVWLNAHIGAGLYLYSRRHIKRVSTQKAIFYSVFGSVLFNFGSIMLWAWERNLMPHSPVLRSALGLMSGGVMLYAAQDYLQYVDNSCSEID